jgi:BMFP domain-containing protein YqiC
MHDASHNLYNAKPSNQVQPRKCPCWTRNSSTTSRGGWPPACPRACRCCRKTCNRGFRATIEAGLGKLDLVTREEFDVQAAVLARTRAKLEALQLRVAELSSAGLGERQPPMSGRIDQRGCSRDG